MTAKCLPAAVIAGAWRSSILEDSREGLFNAAREPFRDLAAKQIERVHDLGGASEIEATIDALWLHSVTNGNGMAGSYYVSTLWRRITRDVLLRDGFLCRACGKDAVLVHHRSYRFEVMAGRDDRQLISLCKPCHRYVHFSGTKKLRKRVWERRLKWLIWKRCWTAFTWRLRSSSGSQRA